MRFLFRNLHVYVFALVSILVAVWVANNPHKTLRQVRPLVEDAVEVGDVAEAAYRKVSQLGLQATSDEAVSLFVATLRMPTMLFERLSEKLEAVEKDVKRRKRADAAVGAGDLRTVKAGVSRMEAGAGGDLVVRPRTPRV